MGEGVAHSKDEAYLGAVIQKRIRLFETIQAQQEVERLKLDPESIKIKLPDGTIKEGKKWLTSRVDIAKEISSRLAASVLIAQVNGTLWDMARPLEGDSDLKLFKIDDKEGRDTFWHSSAHILGQSLEMEYGCKLCIGPCTTRGEKVKTRVIKCNTNPVWNEELTLYVEDPMLPVRLEVFDKDTFSLDDPMGYAEFDICPLAQVVKMNLEGLLNGTIITKVRPYRKNCLADETTGRMVRCFKISSSGLETSSVAK